MNAARTGRWVGLLALVVGIWAGEAESLTLAVTPLEAVFIDGGKVDAAVPAAKAMEDLLQVQLSDSEQVMLVERVQIAQVLKEQGLALSGLIDPTTAARVGQLVKADVIVVGRVRPLDAKRRLATVRAVSVRDSRVLWTGEAQGDDAALAGQAASMGVALLNAVRGGDRGPVDRDTGGATPLKAAKHHERAAVLRALGAHEEAATEELLALRHDPTLAVAESGLLTALAVAGFEGLAAAEAQAAIARGTVPADSPLHALAKGSAMPSAPTIKDGSESQTTRSLRQFVDLVTQRVRSAPAAESTAARKDEIRAWILLGDAYVAERRDRKAREAYREALTRLWEVRASDPLSARETESDYVRLCDNAATRALELSFRKWSNQQELSASVREALNKKQGLPPGAKPPLMEFHCELPIVDRARIASDGSGAKVLLLRIARGTCPEAAVLVRTWMHGVGKQAYESPRARAMDTRWVGTEATAQFARTGVAWPAFGQYGNDQVLGRRGFFDFGSGPNKLDSVLTECLQRRDRDFGFAVFEHIDGQTDPAAARIMVDFVVPARHPTTGLQPTPRGRLRLAVHHLLSGNPADAREELQAIAQEAQSDADYSVRTSARELQILCEVAP